jgi:Lipocalin-like domain
MRFSALILAGVVLCGATAFAQTESEIREQIVGTWKLVSVEETMKDGTIRPIPSLGPHAKGFLMYQRDGYMCAQLVNPDQLQWADPAHATPEEKMAVADRVFAYCGLYEIDVKQERILHLPEIASDPGYVGSRQIRPYRFERGRLIFSDTEKNDPAILSWKIIWKKIR